MPGVCRQTDIHVNPSDSCGCSACPHAVSGPAITGSSDVSCNGLGALRGLGCDMGTHCCCCGPNVWGTVACSPDVLVNGFGWTRLGDMTWCCGGSGNMVTASGDVIVN